MIDKPVHNRAWFFVLPVLGFVLFSSIIPMMTVVNYSVQDTMGANSFFWNGDQWFRDLLNPATTIGARFNDALFRTLAFSLACLMIEVPLGIALALCAPRKGWAVGISLVVIALPMLIPWNVVGTIWQIFTRADIGLFGAGLVATGLHYNVTQEPISAWTTIVVIDVWHWTPLVILLSYAGLRAIPDAYYQAARIDGAKPMGGVLQDRTAEAAEGVGHRGASALHADVHDLHRTVRRHRRRPGQRDDVPVDRSRQDRARPGGSRQRGGDVAGLLPDHAHRVLDLLHHHDPARAAEGRLMRNGTLPKIIFVVYLVVLMTPIYWLINMSLRTNTDIMSGLPLFPRHPTLEKYLAIFNDPTWVHAFAVSLSYVAINTVISVAVALPAAYAFNRYHFIGDKHLFFWLLTNLMAPAAVFAHAVLQSVLCGRAVRLDLGGRARALPVQRAARRVDSRGIRRRRAARDRRDGGDRRRIRFPSFFIRIFLPLIANGIGVTAFFCFMFSWVEQLLATTLTATHALPFAAVMTRAYSVSGMDWSLLAAAGVLTMVPGAFVIWFVRNHIAKGFALGRV